MYIVVRNVKKMLKSGKIPKNLMSVSFGEFNIVSLSCVAVKKENLKLS